MKKITLIVLILLFVLILVGGYFFVKTLNNKELAITNVKINEIENKKIKEELAITEVNEDEVKDMDMNISLTEVNEESGEDKNNKLNGVSKMKKEIKSNKENNLSIINTPLDKSKTILDTYFFGSVEIKNVPSESEILTGLEGSGSHYAYEKKRDGIYGEKLDSAFMKRVILYFLNETQNTIGLEDNQFKDLNIILVDSYIVDENSNNALGYYNDLDNTIVLSTYVNDYVFWDTLKHEFGHFIEAKVMSVPAIYEYFDFRGILDLDEKYSYLKDLQLEENVDINYINLHQFVSGFQYNELTTEMFAEDFKLLFYLPKEVHQINGVSEEYFNTTDNFTILSEGLTWEEQDSFKKLMSFHVKNRDTIQTTKRIERVNTKIVTTDFKEKFTFYEYENDVKNDTDTDTELQKRRTRF